MARFDGKTILITGASSGIGAATARRFGAEGGRVMVSALDEAGCRAVVDDIVAAGGEAAFLHGDLAERAFCDEVVDQTVARFGRLDLLFNNAGINAPGVPLEELSAEQWRAVIDINLTGAFFCTQEAFRVMKDQDPRGGRIINNGSISAHVPRPHSAPYTATKHAITGLTRSTSLDGRKYDIACGQIDIGNAATEMTERMTAGVPQADGSLGVEPRMDVTEVGRAVAFMASQPPASNVQFVTIMATKMPFIGRG